MAQKLISRSYSVKEAIRIGKILEEYNYYFYEEPVPWDWYEEPKHVEEALDIPMAVGEEEFGVHAFRYLIGNEVFQIVQPDLFYYGGMIRTMQVARMAEAAGLQITPHISGGGLGFVYMLQMVSVCPAATSTVQSARQSPKPRTQPSRKAAAQLKAQGEAQRNPG